jgi:hypothetical protein
MEQQDLTLVSRKELKEIAHKLGAKEADTRGKSVKELKALVEASLHTPLCAPAYKTRIPARIARGFRAYPLRFVR